MKKTIAIVLEATLGGTRKHVSDLLLSLDHNKYRLIYIYSDLRADLTFFDDRKILLENNIKLFDVAMENRILSFRNLLAVIRLIQIYKSEKIDVLHLHGAIAGGVGRIAALFAKRMPLVLYTPHGGSFHKIKGGKGVLYKLIERSLIFRTLKFVAVSQVQKNEIINNLQISPERVYLIPNGIEKNNIKKCDSDFTRISFGAKIQKVDIENDLIILFPAVFLEAKGHIPFFKALKNAKTKLASNVLFILAGDGPLYSQVQELVKSIDFLKDRVVFLGFVTDIDNYFSICDLVLLPSVSEAFGYVILESFLHRKPVLATEVGGIRDLVVENINGNYFNFTKIDLLVDLINYYNGNRHLLNILGNNGFEMVNTRFSINKMIEQLENVYNSA